VSDGWQRYAAPAAFLLAVTVAVVLVRSGLESGGGTTHPSTTATTAPLTLSTTTAGTTTTVRRPPAKRYYTVEAGDTFGVIASKTGVPVATIQRLNPTVASTSLHIGQRIRVQ
jgi:LysM repeat protein